MIFRAYCTSLYGSVVCHVPVFWLRLRVAYNDVFRYLLSEPRWCSASALFVTYNVQCTYTFDALIRKLVFSFRFCVVLATVTM